MKSKIKMPEEFRRFFWDVNFASLDTKKNQWFIIERLVNKAGLNAARWLIKTYSKKEIKDVLTRNYNISTKSINLWAALLKINKNLCECMRRPLHLRVFD